MTETLSAAKYIVFFVTLLVGVPLGFTLSLKFPRVEKVIFFLMIFFTVKMEDINFVSRETFRLTSKGFEIGLVDIATFIIFLLVLNRKKRFPLQAPPGTYIYLTYLLFSGISIINAAVPLFSMFEVWKMLRMYMYFFVVFNYVNDFEQFHDFMKGCAAIIIYIFYEVMKQKYILGKFQASGPFPHQNSLVMYTIILGSIVFAFLMNKKDLKPLYFFIWLMIFAMSAVIVISALSRAGLVLFAIAVLIVLTVSFFAGITEKKVWIAVILLICSMAMMAKAWNSIQERFRTAPEESATTRVDLAIAALKMVKDEPLGIGLNNFGIKINPPWQYSSHIEMHDAEDEDEKNGLVETIYLMIAAECGWHTMVIYFLFIFYFYFLNLKNFFRYKGSDYQYFTIAMVGGLLAIYVESGLEWVLKQTNNYYQLMLMFALIAVMSKLGNRYSLAKISLPANLTLKQRLHTINGL
ncbi:MAG: hypothetical protein CVU48_03140 [Candidatus Cloacimonetes bacterium HGW-Cloacimonetes-1]|jgi:hypothetical protein|nr:MAG: hypothetical protein CVU48_03140 [Candidatus Cloacimonetes bacterium HGW-Cloacimonetes-1]